MPRGTDMREQLRAHRAAATRKAQRNGDVADKEFQESVKGEVGQQSRVIRMR